MTKEPTLIELSKVISQAEPGMPIEIVDDNGNRHPFGGAGIFTNATDNSQILMIFTSKGLGVLRI